MMEGCRRNLRFQDSLRNTPRLRLELSTLGIQPSMRGNRQEAQELERYCGNLRFQDSLSNTPRLILDLSTLGIQPSMLGSTQEALELEQYLGNLRFQGSLNNTPRLRLELSMLGIQPSTPGNTQEVQDAQDDQEPNLVQGWNGIGTKVHSMTLHLSTNILGPLLPRTALGNTQGTGIQRPHLFDRCPCAAQRRPFAT
jgi:hypothetical protein